MSGTSVDGIDAAVVDVSQEDDALVVKLLGYAEAPMDEALRQRIHALFSPEASRVDEVCEVNVLLGEAFASAIGRAGSGVLMRSSVGASDARHACAPTPSLP